MTRTLPAVLLAMGLLAGGCTPPEERAAEFLAKAHAAWDAGDLKTATLEARNATQVEPKNADAHYLLAQIYEKEGKLRETIGSLLLAVDADPAHVDAHLKLGSLYFYGEAYEQAQAHAEAAAKLAPDNPDVRLLQARLAFQKQEFEQGMELVDAVIAQDGRNQDALVLKAITLAARDKAAARAFVEEKLKDIEPARAQALRRVRLGLLMAGNDAAGVEQELQALGRDFPEVTEYPLQLAAAYRAEGRVDDAERVIRDLVERMPGDVAVRLGLVQFLAQAR
jgi:tetratricopeptide (TPR) repeat protein